MGDYSLIIYVGTPPTAFRKFIRIPKWNGKDAVLYKLKFSFSGNF